ncbi:MAG: GNAT family N-acetyltransferase [Myxococcota bacterium]|nr:GNAT family N-acetyltransferase [Myxococcota bacterium]
MAQDRKLERRVEETLEGYYALGNEVIDLGSVRFIRNRAHPNIHDANHGVPVRVETAGEIEAVLEHAEEIYAGYRDRLFRCSSDTPAAFEARLVVEGYALSTEVQLLLEGELSASPREMEIRRAETDSDWDAIYRLLRLDHEEDARRFGGGPMPEQVTRSMLAIYRAKCPPLRFWIAHEDGVDCGFFSSWPGQSGVGQVEDLFTQEEFRGRGIATALIVRAVTDARERGAGPVVIGARTDDWPKRFYHKLGFRPILLKHQFHKQLPET